ncbi:hypothetical protein D3C85_1258840 [compost metagenome]
MALGCEFAPVCLGVVADQHHRQAAFARGGKEALGDGGVGDVGENHERLLHEKPPADGSRPSERADDRFENPPAARCTGSPAV